MHIEVEEKAKNWLQTKGEQLSVKTIAVNACCAPPIQEIITHLYHEIKVDNLSIFVEKPLCSNEKMTLKLAGFGIFKTISAKVQGTL